MRLLKHYLNPAVESKTIIVEGKEFQICKLPADLALRLQIRIATTLAPLIAGFGKDMNVGELISSINLDDEKVSDLIIDVVGMCQVYDPILKKNRMVDFNMNDITTLKMPYLLAFEFLKYNFETFFLDNPIGQKMAEKAGGINLQEMMKK